MTPHLQKATLADYPTIQNMACFYIYEMSRYCGWECPKDGLFKSKDFLSYFTDNDRHAFFIMVEGEIAGFVLINQTGTTSSVNWNIGEFFILAKFQKKTIGQKTAEKIFDLFPGTWEIAVISENLSALNFWNKTLSLYTKGNFSRTIKNVSHDQQHPRVVFQFSSPYTVTLEKDFDITIPKPQDILSMVALSSQKRAAYAQVQSQFWRPHSYADYYQTQWFEKITKDSAFLIFVAKDQDSIQGFIIGQLVEAPKVYDPGGLTLMIDDFCVASSDLWISLGHKLIQRLQLEAKSKNASQVLIVAGHHDELKRLFLKKYGFEIASEWFIKSI